MRRGFDIPARAASITAALRSARVAAIAAIPIALLCPSGTQAHGGAASPTRTPGTVVRIDVAGGRVAASLPIGGIPSLVAADGTHVWATAINERAVWLVSRTGDTATKISNVASPQTTGLAAYGGRAYVLGADNLKVIDPGRTPMVSTVSLKAIEGSADLVAAGPSGVWGVKGDTAFRVSGARVTATVLMAAREDEEHNGGKTAMAVGRDAVWVIGDRGDRRMWRISTRHPRITNTITLPFAPAGVTLTAGSVWVTDQIGDTVRRYDSRTGRLIASIRVGHDPVGLTAGAGAVWVASDVDGTVSRIDPVTDHVVAQVEVPGNPSQLAFGSGSVWAASPNLGPVPVGSGIRIGVVTDCYGAFSFVREQTIAGPLPLLLRGAHLSGRAPSDGVTGATLAGRPVTLMTACENWENGSSTISALSQLVDRDHAEIVIGSEFNYDGLAERDFAWAHPDVTFFVTGFEQSAMLKHAPSNIFRFEADSVQWFAGLGTYARQTLGWRNAATVSNADGSSWPLVQAFDAEFCSLGGHITPEHRVWVDVFSGDQLGNHLPRGVDGVWLPGGTPGPFGGTDTFVPRWSRTHTPVGRHLMVGWAVLSPDPHLLGVVGSSSDPYAATPAFTRFLNAYAAHFTDYPDPGLFDQAYYDAMEPLAEAVEAVHGRLGSGQSRLRSALEQLRYHGPAGLITLDRHHQGIVPIYLAKVVRSNGSLTIKQIKVIPHVDESFGGLFSASTPAPSMTSPACVAGNPPPWAE